MNMIKKTRYKFMGITLAAISLVLILILGLLNVSVYGAIYFTAKENIEEIRDRRGFIFSSAPSELPGGRDDSIPVISDVSGKTSYMYIKINNRTRTPFITTNMSDTYSSNEIFYLAETLSESGKEKGMYNNMMYEVSKDDLNTVVVIIDMSNDLSLMHNLYKVSLVIIIFSILFVYIFSYFLSKWAIKPVKNAFENQRRFISDASHELKTPLTVISANADVLESEIGENKWLGNIKSQSVIMSQLVYDLLDLAKLDETKGDMEMKEFDLSSVVLGKALEFECTAFENHKHFEQNIKENIKYTGNEDSIKHLISILIDNAIKHSEENGTVRVTLTTNGGKKIFQVYNTGNGIKDDEKDKIFNRFYRSDKSRSKETGGYGLGLAIAKATAEAHKGTISVDGEEGKWISFTVVL